MKNAADRLVFFSWPTVPAGRLSAAKEEAVDQRRVGGLDWELRDGGTYLGSAPGSEVHRTMCVMVRNMLRHSMCFLLLRLRHGKGRQDEQR